MKSTLAIAILAASAAAQYWGGRQNRGQYQQVRGQGQGRGRFGMYRGAYNSLEEGTQQDFRTAIQDRNYVDAYNALQGDAQGQVYLNDLQDKATQWQDRRQERWNASDAAANGETAPEYRTFNFNQPIDTSLSEEEQE